MTWWTWPSLRGAVLEQIPGQLVDIGAGGCSLETSSRLAEGTFGFIEIQGRDASIGEVARVCAVTERPGAAAPYLVRLEFLPIALPPHAMVSETTGDAYGVPLVATGEKAGHSLTLVRSRKAIESGSNQTTAQDAPERHGYATAGHRGLPLADDLKK